MSEFNSFSVHEIVKHIKDAKITSVEICQSYIERINKFEKDIKAWVHFDKKLLLERAEEADNYRRSGKPTGPLHGITVALKDIIDDILERQSDLKEFEDELKKHKDKITPGQVGES